MAKPGPKPGVPHKLSKGTTRPDPKIKREVELACKRLSRRALKVLENAMDDPAADHRVKIEAAKEILNRAWGKPKVQVQQDININSSEEFMNLLTSARQRQLEGRVIDVTPPEQDQEEAKH